MTSKLVYIIGGVAVLGIAAWLALNDTNTVSNSTGNTAKLNVSLPSTITATTALTQSAEAAKAAGATQAQIQQQIENAAASVNYTTGNQTVNVNTATTNAVSNLQTLAASSTYVSTGTGSFAVRYYTQPGGGTGMQNVVSLLGWIPGTKVSASGNGSGGLWENLGNGYIDQNGNATLTSNWNGQLNTVTVQDNASPAHSITVSV